MIQMIDINSPEIINVESLDKALDDLTQAMGISSEMLGTANKAKFKFNGGAGALLCSKCNKLIKDGSEFTQEELKAYKGKITIAAKYCDWCSNK
jgi:hypothetical protein